MTRVHDLSFAIALPPDWRDIDLLEPDAGRLIDGPLADALAIAARSGEKARMMMLRGLVTLTGAAEPLAAGLAVTVAAPGAGVSDEPLDADGFAGREVSAVQLPAGAGLRVRHLTSDRTLQLQYLIETRLGLLTLTFATFQAAQTEDWEQLFDAMARTSELVVASSPQ